MSGRRRIVLCESSQVYGQPFEESVSDDAAGRAAAAAHVGARRLVWRYWRQDYGDEQCIGIAVPPGTVIPPDSSCLPDGINRWAELLVEVRS